MPMLSLVGCTVCGFSVALLWPGSYTLGAEILPRGGTPMFALFALAGDIGCAAGPSLIGIISDAVSSDRITSELGFLTGDAETVGIKLGLLLAALFPAAAVIACLMLFNTKKPSKSNIN